MQIQEKMFSNKSLYIIAEVANAAQGVVENNHLLIDAAANVGADGIKFQFYKYDEIATPSYEKYENFKRTFYTEDQRLGFVEHAFEKNLDVLVDIFDRWAVEVVRKGIKKIKAIKIPPSIIMDDELVKMILCLGKPVLIGVGGYSDEEIDYVLSKLKKCKNEIVLLHGFQAFPTDEKDSSLLRIQHLKDKYNLPVGFADHVDAKTDMAIRLPEYAFFAGASVIEKHIILSRSSKGLDHWSSLEPEEFSTMVKNLRRCVDILGSEKIALSGKDYLKHSSRVTTTKKVEAGQLLSRRNIKFRRTDNKRALFPNQWSVYNPAVAARDLDTDVGISSEDVRKGVIGTIVNCRMHSTRLLRKALVEINGVSSIERCLFNALASKRSQITILATSTHSDDQVLKDYTLEGRAKFIQGSEKDIAARYIQAAEKFGLDIMIRVPGDRTLISPELMDFLVDEHIKAGADFSFLRNSAHGINPEVINTSALKRLKTLVSTEEYSEYLTDFFKNNPEYFVLNEVESPS